METPTLEEKILSLEQDYLRLRGINYSQLMDELIVLRDLLATGRPMRKPHGIIMLARGLDGDDEMHFETAADLYWSYHGKVPIVINGGNGLGQTLKTKLAWPGKDVYERKLMEMGVSKIIVGAPGTHTRDENRVFTDVIIDYGWTDVAVLNLPQYHMRSLLGWLNELQQRGLSGTTRLYPVSPASGINWRREVLGAQNASKKPRNRQWQEEWFRILSYSMGEYRHRFATIPELTEYLLGLNTN